MPPPNPPRPTSDPNQKVMSAFMRFIQDRWTNVVLCPICSSSDWDLRFAADLPMRYLSAKVLTAVPVACTNCRYLMFFDAVGAGLFDEIGNPIDADHPVAQPWLPTPE
jgi:hypothetical protein